jgi:hypothetical protein
VFQGELPHAIIFLYDADNDTVEVPEYEDGAAAQSNENAVSIPAIVYFDGSVHIEVGEFSDDDLSGLQPVGVFSVRCPHRKIDVNSSEKERLATYRLHAELAVLSIFVDEPGYAATIKVRVTA